MSFLCLSVDVRIVLKGLVTEPEWSASPGVKFSVAGRSLTKSVCLSHELDPR